MSYNTSKIFSKFFGKSFKFISPKFYISMVRDYQKFVKRKEKNMYNYYPQNRTPMTYTPATLKGHPVSSLEEVKATSIDFDGSIFYFPDIANKRIYTKTVGLDGIATLNMYELKPIPQENQITGDFITRQEFDQAIAKVFATIQPSKEPATSPPNFKEVF